MFCVLYFEFAYRTKLPKMFRYADQSLCTTFICKSQYTLLFQITTTSSHCWDIMMNVCSHVFLFFYNTACPLISLKQQELGSEQPFLSPTVWCYCSRSKILVFYFFFIYLFYIFSICTWHSSHWPPSLHTDRRWNGWTAGAATTTWSWTCPKLSGGTPHHHCPPSPDLTALCQLWNPSGFWDPPSPRTWNGYPTSTQSSKRPNRGCTSGASSGSSTCLRRCWCSSTLQLLSLFPHIHHCLVWPGHLTRQEKTTMDSQDCRKDHWHQPAHHQGLVHLQSQEESREALQTADPSQTGWLLPSGRCYRTLYAKTARHNKSFLPHTITLMNSQSVL